MIKKGKIIFFDLGNVLIKEVHPSLFEAIYSKIVNPRISRQEYDKKMFSIINESFYGRLTLEATWEKIRTSIKIGSVDFFSIKESINRNNYNKELVKVVKEIKKNIAVGVLSDLSQIGLHVVKNNLGDLLELCEEKNIFLSTIYGLTKIKDGERFFDLVIESTPFETENIFFVDDNVKSVELARSKRINGILFIHDKDSDSWSESNRLLLTEFKKYGLF